MNFDRGTVLSWPGLLMAVLLAAGLGFAVARWITPAPDASSNTEQNQQSSDFVAVTPEGLRATGIATEQVTSGDLGNEVIAPATVDPEVRGAAVLMAHVAGSISRISGRVGDRVEAGETLAIVTSRDAAALAAARATAEARLTATRANLMREKDLFAKQVTPRQELEQVEADYAAAEAAAAQARTAASVTHVLPDGSGVAIVTPLSGTIVSRTAVLGQFVQAETELFQVSDSRDIDIDVAVSGQDAQRIRAGDPAKVRTRAGVLVNARVRAITPTLNDATRSATAVLDPLPGEPALMIGDVLTAELIPADSAAKGVVVPAEAVQNLDGRDVVFVRVPKGFRARPVIVGSRSAGHAALVAGIKPGETIATANAFFLKAEMRKPTGED